MTGRHDDDRRLRAAMRRLRDADRGTAPGFDEMLARGTARPAPVRAAWRWAFAAAGVLAACTLLLLVMPDGTGPTVDEATLARARELSAWSSPSDELWDYGPLEVAQDVPTLELTTLSGLAVDVSSPAGSGEPAPDSLPSAPGLV
ncbi:MAG: hypothetical protein D6738_08390 [Acidobacteria bacterium]|nr:MAG: hypothetical protein D6738_08390 [Acidobacteriota bacterium]